MHAIDAAPPRAAATLPTQDDVLAQAGRENFTVASAVLGADRRRHLLALYGYARLVDDVGDESAGDRTALLDEVERQLDAIYTGSPPEHPVMRALAESVNACGLPVDPLRRLIEANRRDQVVHRYETFDELLGYCRLSAAPVGELVLGVFGAATPERIALSDRICAALQIVEHLQDIEEDHARGRIYMPAEDLAHCGCTEEDLAAAPASGPGAAARRALVALEADRALRLLAEGAPLAPTLPVRPRLAVAGFVAGGRAALAGVPRGDGSGRSGSGGGDCGRGWPRRVPQVWELLRAAGGR
jgi:squalene synthase HpnC